MTERILGLDIGIASVGSGLIDYNKEDISQNKILFSGVRIFTQAENPKTGESLALPRRLARGSRRVIRRKRQRMQAIKNLFIQYLDLKKSDLFIQEDGTDKTIYREKGKSRPDVWELRHKAVHELLNNVEFARVLTHIAKRRGYKSNRKSIEENDSKSDSKKVLSAIKENEKYLEKYTTIGEAIYELTIESRVRRNRPGDFSFSVSREMLTDEIKTIFSKQREFGNTYATEAFEEAYLTLFLKQRDFASVDDMVGSCTLEAGEKRAPKRALSSEEFVTLTKLINTKIIDENDKERFMTKEELQKAIELCKKTKEPTYLELKELLALNDTDFFKGVDFYEVNKKTGEVSTKKNKFKSAFIGYHELRIITEKTLSKVHWKQLSQHADLLNEIAVIFSYHKSDEKIQEALEQLTFPDINQEEKDLLINAMMQRINFGQFLYLSLKAIDKLLVHMREGKRYDGAVATIGYKKETGIKQKYLRGLTKEEANELTNPVVKRALAQTRKVINAIIREYGPIDKIHIELTREIKKSHKDRKQIKDAQDEYQKFKAKVVEEFKEHFSREPRGNEFTKFRLWKEQDGRCAYSGFMGSKGYIDPKRLIEDPKYAEIDHILPYSRSLDDSMSNKVLCLAHENQEKRDRTPYEYFMAIGRDWEQYEVFVRDLKDVRRTKKQKLLKKNFDENSAKEFRERNINDTAYMARFIKNFIEDNLELGSKEKNKVLTRSGTLTNMLRYNWHVGDKSRETNLHHAVDAIIIAFSTQSEVQRLSTLSAKIEGFAYTKSEEKAGALKFKPPMENFRDAVQKSIDNIFVSFAPRKKVTGEAHDRLPYSKLPERNIKNKRNKNEIKKGLEINGGIVLEGEIKRLDIFRYFTNKKTKYFSIPIRVADFEKNTLPDSTYSGKKIDIDDPNYTFLFSIFKNDLIEIKTKKTPKKDEKILQGYFIEPAGDSMILCTHDNRPADNFTWDEKKKKYICKIGIQNAIYVKKFQVGILGKIYEVKHETRVGTKKMLRKQRKESR